MQIYRTLENLQRPVSTWDDFLVFLTVQKLDSESVKAWEQHLGSSKELPTWAQLQEFLVTRLLSLQAYEKSRNMKIMSHSHQSSIKAHYHSKSGESSALVQKQCPICTEKHYVGTCPQYFNKTSQQRIELIKKHKLCYNCLGPHRALQCKSTKRCQNCAAKHHTTIHQAYNLKTKARNPSKESHEATSQQEDKQVLHSSIKQKINMPSVLLATALVKIITKTGMTSTARVLIDPGSEISLVV